MIELKVFDSFPNEIHKALHMVTRNIGNGIGNDCYIKWTVESEKPEREDCESDKEYDEWLNDFNSETEARIVDNWLMKQGCTSDEDVIMEHSW